MKKSLTLALAATTLFTAAAIAQDEPAKPAAATPEVSNSCKNKVQVTEVSGSQQGGGQMFDYFITLKNPTTKDLFIDVKLDNFPGSTHLYSPILKDQKVKPGKTQTIRLGNGTNNNMSLATVTVQVDKDKPSKKPTVSLVNCREKK